MQLEEDLYKKDNPFFCPVSQILFNSFVHGHVCIQISTLILLKPWSGVRFNKIKPPQCFMIIFIKIIPNIFSSFPSICVKCAFLFLF